MKKESNARHRQSSVVAFPFMQVHAVSIQHDINLSKSMIDEKADKVVSFTVSHISRACC